MKLASLCLCASVAVSLHAQGNGYVVDNGQGQVKVLDLGPRRVSATIPSGKESSEIHILANNRFAFVSNQADNNVALLDLFSNTRVTTIATGQAPGSMASTPDGRFLYVANEGSNDVTVIDIPARKVAATIPVGATPVNVNLSPNGQFAYVVNQDETPEGTVSVIDVNRKEIVKTLTVGQRPNQFAVAPNLTTAYVVNTGSNSLSVVDLSRNEVIGTPVAVGQGPVGVAFSTDGTVVYAINGGSNSISVIRENRAGSQIVVGTKPVAMEVTFDSKFGYVSNQGSNTVSVLDLTTNTAEDSISVGSGPFSIKMDPNEDFLYVTNLNSGTVSVIDMNTDTVRAPVTVGGIPVQFELLNAPTLLEVAPNPAPVGTPITLKGEGFLPNSAVLFTTSNPPLTLKPSVTFVDSETLQVTVPSFSGSSAIVSVVNPDGNASEELTFRVGPASPAPSINRGGVVEGAGFAPAPYPISGNSIVSVYGNFPGVVEQKATAFPLPATLGNATVTFDGMPAPLLYVSPGQINPGQINLVAPTRLFAASNTQVAVTVGGQTSAPETVNVAPAAPGIFFNAASGAGAFLHGIDNSLVTASAPARRAETIVMFLTGLGNTAPPPIDGQPARSDMLSPTTVSPIVMVGGTAANVRFSGLAPGFSGLYQINFDVPPATLPAPDVAVSVSTGAFTSNTVRLAVQ